MSTEQELTEADTLLKKSLDAFFADEEARVLVLKGDWGVGKTFFWNEYIQNCIQDNKHPASQKMAYSYVSLFGIDSLSHVKEATFHNAQAIQSIASVKEFLSTEVDKKSLSRSFSLLSNQVLPNTTKVLKKLAPNSGGYQPAVSFLQDKMINRYVVCIDDLERKHQKLSLKEVMGYADVLVNQKNCKVVMIFNEGCLEKEDKKEFEDYREKVVDVELTYNPSYAGNLSHVFNSSSPYHSHLLKVIPAFEIKNIRVLKKIRWAIDCFHLKLNGAHEQVIEDVITHIILFCWSFYNAKDSVPFGFVKKRIHRHTMDSILSDKEKCKSPEEIKYQKLVYSLHLDGAEYDKYIIGLLECGYTSSEDFQSTIKSCSERAGSDSIKGILNSIWDDYTGTFEENKDEVITKIEAMLDGKLEQIRLRDFAESIKMLSGFGSDVDDYIDSYTKKREDYLQKIDLRLGSWGDIHPKLLSIVESVYEANKQQNIDEITLMIITKGAWSPDDVEYLASLTEDDYFNWMNNSPSGLMEKIQRGLLTFSSVNADSEKSITSNVLGALRKIAALSDFNKQRVADIYHINFDKK